MLAFLPMGTGGGEYLLLLLVILVVYGPRRLSQAARGLGRTLRRMQHAAEEFKHHLLEATADDDEPPASGKGESSHAARSRER